MNMQDCTQFDHCSAPICPLDKEWRMRKHLKSDPVCLWLREYAKDPELPNIDTCTAGELMLPVSNCFHEVFTTAGYSDIRVSLNRAAKCPSKIKQFKENAL